jgi:acyl-CoA dehydrogenase
MDNHRQERIRQSIAEISGDVLRKFADEVDRDARFPSEAFAALKQQRLLGIALPTEYGGDAASLGFVAELCSILAGYCSSTAMIYAMHQVQLFCLMRHGMASPWHRDFMHRVAADQLLLASATSERGVGGDLRNSVCALTGSEPRLQLEKDAPVISYGRDADAILISARRSTDAPNSDQVLVVAHSSQYRLDITRRWNSLGMRGTCSDGFKLTAAVAREQALPDAFSEIVSRSMTAIAHILWGSVWLGIANDALARARKFVRAQARRHSGGVPPGAGRLAETSIVVRTAAAVLADAIARWGLTEAGADERAGDLTLAMNDLKVTLSRSVIEAVQQAMLVCGIESYQNDTPYSLGRQMRDALSAPLMISNDRILGTSAALNIVEPDRPWMLNVPS